MRTVAFFLMMFMACEVAAWTSEAEMDAEVCTALAAGKDAWRPAFVSQLQEAATNGRSAEMRCEASMLLSLSAWQSFLDTMDEAWMGREMAYATNAVEQIGTATNTWQYWMARFVHAGAHASNCRYVQALSILGDSIDRMTREHGTNEVTDVERAILRLFEMPDLVTVDAMRAFSGMSAAALGDGNAATNFAVQLPPRYRTMIFRALNGK